MNDYSLDTNYSSIYMPTAVYSQTPLINISLPPPNYALGLKVTTYAYCYILPVICLLGIIGNVMNVITLASSRLRAVSYLYLRALAIADLLCMIFVLLFVSGEILSQYGILLNRNYWYGFYQAHFMLSLINWALSTGVCVVLALSLERYISIVFPLHFRAWNSPQRAKKAIFIAYLMPLLWYIPYGISRYSVGYKTNTENTTIFMAIDSEVSKTFYWKVYKWIRESLLRFLPILVLSLLNFQIIIAFRKRQKMFEKLKNRKKNQVSKDDTILYILGGIVAMFFICNIPAAINLLFINETVKKRVDYQIFRAVANLLEITNHAAQFYIFCVCSTDYRVTFMQKFPLPCFKAYYLNKKHLLSFLKKDPKETSTFQFASMKNNTSTTTLQNNQNRSKSDKTASRSVITLLKKRSTTISFSFNEALEANIIKKKNSVNFDENFEAAEINLASGEEDISDESNTFFYYNALQNTTGKKKKIEITYL